MQEVSAQRWWHSVSEGLFSKISAPDHRFAAQFGIACRVSLDLCLICELL